MNPYIKENFNSDLYSALVKLVKKSENNVEIMTNFLKIANFEELDMSKHAEDMIIGTLKSYYFSEENHEQIYECILSLSKRIKDPTVIKLVLEQMLKIVTTTSIEKNKLMILKYCGCLSQQLHLHASL